MTPSKGPWTYDEFHGVPIIIAADGSPIVSLATGTISGAYPDARIAADARVIVAVPDLLEAAKDAVEHTGCGDPDCCAAAIAQSQAIDRLRAAITKAEGR